MALSYFTTNLQIAPTELPPLLLQRNSVSTAFAGRLTQLSDDSSGDKFQSLAFACEKELPPAPNSNWRWNDERANVLREITIRIRQRATMFTASAIVAMLLSTRSLKSKKIFDSIGSTNGDTEINLEYGDKEEEAIFVGYTGGCK